MELIGKVLDIIYYNDKNAYTVFLFKTEEKTFTCVGYIPYIKSGDKLTLAGEMTEHSVYGKQFKVITFDKSEPSSDEELIEYLSSGVIKGIGEKTAEKILNKFGEDSINILKNEPEKLATVRGISLEKAQLIQETVNNEWSFLQLARFLTPYGISVTNINNVYKEYGVNSLNLIYEDPYILVDVLQGVEFSYIDKIAVELNFESNSIKRVKSGIKYCLINALYNGNTCAEYERLVIAVKNFLGIDDERIDDAILELVNEKQVVVEYRNKEDLQIDRFVYLKNIYKIENMISNKLLEMVKFESTNVNITKKLDRIQEELHIELTTAQKDAIFMAYNNNLSIITGGPGTGKTTIIKCLLKLFELDDEEIGLCAPTGRAAKRMTELTGNDSKTIHRLLEIAKMDENITKIEINVNELQKDIVIVDEASMLDSILFAYILKALKPGTKLVLIGDADQLPSVGPGEILKNLIQCEHIPHVYLDEIFRQAKESLIIVNAHKVNEGKYPDLTKVDKDFFFMPIKEQQDVVQKVIDLCSKRLKDYGNYDSIRDIQVITPTKRGETGTRSLNKYLQSALNPKEKYKEEKTFGQVTFRIGDKVMQTKNNYDIQWEKYGMEGSGVFNGDFGYITKIDTARNEIEVKFDDDKVVTYTASILEELEHSYAITVHKSQGSEFDVVVMPILNGPPMLYTRNLLYTGITRAKKLLVIVGDEIQLRKMVDNSESKHRTTGLEYKLKIW